MVEADLFQVVVTNIPNFVFGAAAIYVLYRQNNRLMDINERLCKGKECDDCGEKAAAA